MELPVLEEQVEVARRAGARACELLLEVTAGVDLAMVNGKVVDRVEVATQQLTVTTWLGEGRRGQVRGAPGDVKDLIERALAAAEKAPERPDSGPVDRLRPVVGGLSVEDRRYAHLDEDGRIEVLELSLIHI